MRGCDTAFRITKHERGADGGQSLGRVEFDMCAEVEVRVEVEAQITPHEGIGDFSVFVSVEGDAERREGAGIARSDEMGDLEFVRFEDDANGFEEFDKSREKRAQNADIAVERRSRDGSTAVVNIKKEK